MIFGFTYTLVTGFILTAGGDWTGLGPVKGVPLLILLLLWTVERIVILTSVSPEILIALTLLFPIFFTYQLIKLLDTYKMKFVFITLISLIPITRLFYFLAVTSILEIDLNFLYEIILWALIMLTSIIAGRVTPRFTMNFFDLKGPLQSPKPLLLTAFILTFAMIVNVFEHVPSTVKMTITVAAGLAQLFRMAYWHSFQALKKPIIGFLHIGFFMLTIAIIYKGLTYPFPQLDIYRASLHFIVMGAISFIAMNIMIRASLGHTGRKVQVGPTIFVIFICLLVGVIVRAGLPVIFPTLLVSSLHYSMGFWTLGFLIYLIKFLPILVTKRIDKD